MADNAADRRHRLYRGKSGKAPQAKVSGAVKRKIFSFATAPHTKPVTNPKMKKNLTPFSAEIALAGASERWVFPVLPRTVFIRTRLPYRVRR
jgi:hypothetical protein